MRFFLVGICEGTCVHPPPGDTEKLKNKIAAAIESVHEDTLCKVYDEFSYHLDVIRAADNERIDHL